MRKQLKSDQKFGSRVILRFVAYIGKREYYKVRCTGCNTEFTMERSGIEEKVNCRRCNGLKIRPFSRKRNERLK